MKPSPFRRVAALAAIAIAAGAVLTAQQPSQPQSGDGFRFRTGVELINVAVTVTDSSGRFVPGLRREDFIVYEDDAQQDVTHFSAERVPVSLGLVVDTSGSMQGEKWEHAVSALDRFLLDLLGQDDEVFMYRFSFDATLVQGWTSDRERLSRAIGRIFPRGGTAMYDAVAAAVPLAASGHNRKKAIVIISDGNDTNSVTSVQELKQAIRESEVLVYAVGIDGDDRYTSSGPFRRPPTRIPLPFPFPGSGRGQWPRQPIGGQPQFPQGPGPGTAGQPPIGPRGSILRDDRVNAAALMELTDDSGGRTEIVESSRDLEPATTSIADELSRQYFLAYPAAAKKDGRWHTIRVEVRDGRYTVRARRGYVAS
jgi:Ca-activated chloride channel family protein